MFQLEIRRNGSDGHAIQMEAAVREQYVKVRRHVRPFIPGNVAKGDASHPYVYNVAHDGRAGPGTREHNICAENRDPKSGMASLLNHLIHEADMLRPRNCL